MQRFTRFTAGWDVTEIRELGRLLDKLEASIADAVRDDPPVTAPPWRHPRAGPDAGPEPAAPASSVPTALPGPDRSDQS